MSKNNSWKEESWENFLKKYWDKRPKGIDIVEYTKDDLEPFFTKYNKSGQGEIRIFHYEHEKVKAVKKRGISKIPLTRTSWALIKSPQKIELIEPSTGGKFVVRNKLTDGMVAGIKQTMKLRSNPGETTLLAIANHSGIIADFYDLKDPGILFTGGRQGAGVHLVINNKDIDVTKAQIEIDGGFEWSQDIVIAEMKSSFKQSEFDINQALLPMLKWEQLLKNKKVHSLILLAETNATGIEYWAYDLIHNKETSDTGMIITRSKKYILQVI